MWEARPFAAVAASGQRWTGRGGEDTVTDEEVGTLPETNMEVENGPLGRP